MDRVVAGSMAGMASGFLTGAISNIMYLLGVCTLSMNAIGGGMFTREMLSVNAPLSWQLLGWVTHLIVSSMFGVILVYILVFTGRDYAILKGLLFGSAAWFVAISLVSPLAGFVPRNANPVDLFIMLGYHVLFGVFAAWLLVRYAEPALIRIR